jgi:UDP-N-acetylenolpyruvoylglucosamine reductase
VIEADESDGTLGLFHPEQAIVLNVDADHLDHFSGIDAILEEFRSFGEQTTGRLIFCADDPRLAELYARNPRAVSYGRHPLAVYRAEILSPGAPEPAAFSQFEVWHQGARLGVFRTELLGEQNISNATAVIALLHQLGYSPDAIAPAIARFRGAARRQQELYHDARCRLFEDYGHHPNEIRATLRALRSTGAKRLLVAFQPHRYTRTQHLWKEFATCFAEADRLWLAEVYPASEPEIPGINSGFLAGAIRAEGQQVEGVHSLAHLGDAILGSIEPGDVVLFLGAGDITCAAHELADRLRSGLPAASGPVPNSPAISSFHAIPAMNAELYAQLAQRLPPETVLRRDESLARRTTLRVGGTADLYIEPASEEDLAVILRFCRTASMPVFILGRGSNLLIRDGGIRGVVLSLAHPHFGEIRASGETVRCGAGARLKSVVAEARRHGLGGLEFLEGIPGSVGGALRMNAGAMGSWLFDVVQTISFMDFTGAIHERVASEVNVEYRGCPLFKDHIALSALLKGQPAPQEAIRARMESFSRIRWDSQPSQPSAGCIFKNPGAIPAGKLIDELGLKGTRVGGASVSDVHANFIVNDGTATARDVLNLIDIIKERANSARGIALETEVQILGEG